MPNFKISQLTTATAVSATNQFEINQNAASRSLEVSVLSTYIRSGDSGKAIVVSVSTASDAVRITQTGTGNALVVEDSANPDSTPFVVDASGNVGIGTSSPSALLHVNGNSKFGALVTTGLGVSTGDAGLEVGGERSGNGNSIIDLHAVAGADFSARLLRLSGANGQFEITNSGTGALAFATSSTERMRIDSSGNLLVGASSSPTTFRVYSEISGAHYGMRHPSATAGRYFFIQSDSNNDLYIQSQALNGVYLTNTGTSWASVSDERLKENLKQIKNAADKVSTLRAVTGKYKTDEEGISRSFLIAQDVYAVLPEAVSVRNDDQKTLGLSYTDVIPLLVAAIQELKAEIDLLKGKR
jgi:hypothetical protein